MKSRFLSLLALVGVSACAGSTPPLEMSGPPVGATVVQGAPNDRIREKRTKTVIRAYRAAQTKDGEPTRVEVAGAKCTLTSDHLRAEVITPQEILVPKYDQIGRLEDRGVPPSILVECHKDGLSGKALIAAKPGEILSGSGNLVADLVLIAGSAAVASTKDWKYHPLIMVGLE